MDNNDLFDIIALVFFFTNFGGKLSFHPVFPFS